MNDQEHLSLVRLRDCWMSGGAAFALAPDAWKSLIDTAADEERERWLLAIAGQAFDVALRPAAPSVLVKSAPLPRLALPTVPDQHRAMFKVALKLTQSLWNTGLRRSRLLALVASRGFTAHPLDWMPTASDTESPALYAPWVDWLNNADTHQKAPPETLTEQSWDDFYPAARRVLLSEMRALNPAAARALIEAKADKEPAETRLTLITILNHRLGVDDAPYLKSLASDRSGKVRDLAVHLLARLEGHTLPNGEASGIVAELVGFIEQSKTGIIFKKIFYSPMEIKSAAQQKRRDELLDQCSLANLAAMLNIDEEEFLARWQFGKDNDMDKSLVEKAAFAVNDGVLAQLADRLLASDLIGTLSFLLPRLDEPRRLTFMHAMLDGQFQSLGLLDHSLFINALKPADIAGSRAFKAMCAVIAEKANTGNDRDYYLVPSTLQLFGFLADSHAAQSVLDAVLAAGLSPTDPALALLRLNTALSSLERSSPTDGRTTP